ncbi:uncharacterized protein V1516DRAFT_619576 [Lipomyces oligophaga]|uniref:uncharacterized protein n=1 Tax=Lipomyces oligophaga TaxID=45792 RepID=UPI0034CE018D
MESNRAGLLVFLLIIMLLTPDSSSPAQLQAFQEFLKAQKWRRSVLMNSTFADGPVDLEGIQNPVLPPDIERKALDLWDSQIPDDDDTDEISMYRNITGLMRGDWEKLDLGFGQTELPHSREWEFREQANQTNGIMWEPSSDTRNITDSEGIMSLDISEKGYGPVQMIEASLNIQDEMGWNGHDIPLRGLHFVKTGNIVMTTTSRKFAGTFALPFLALTEDRFNQSYVPLLTALNESIDEFDAMYRRDMNPPYSGPSGSPENCEYVVYVQLHASSIATKDMLIVEDELRFPQGQPHKSIPKVVLSLLIYSPNCGTVIESQKLIGDKIERYWDRASSAAQVGAILTLLQIWLLIRQMNDTNTPSTVSRLSFWTVGMMALVDGYLCMGYLTAAIFIESTFLPFMTVAFLSFLLVSVFGMRYLILIYRIQRPERRTNPVPPTPTVAPAATVNADTLPLPAVATPQTAQANIGTMPTNGNTTNQADDDGRGDVSLLYSRFYFILLGLIFASLNASTWPKPYRTVFQNVMFLTVNSYWIPQIYRNVMRGCRRAFNWEFVIGMSVLRLVPMLYLYLFKGNVVFHDAEPLWAMIIAGWVWFQIVILVSQEVIHPRFFVPGSYLPSSYDYHPALTVPDIESSGDTSEGEGIAVNSRGGLSLLGPTDCTICMQTIELPRELVGVLDVEGNNSSSSLGPGAILARRAYMVTPCRHIFHTHCLESWMRFKLQCPSCRSSLPPL